MNSGHFITFITIVLRRNAARPHTASPQVRTPTGPCRAPRPRPRPRRPGPTPSRGLCSRPARAPTARGSRPLPQPISSTSGAEPQAPALLSGHQLVGTAVAYEVAPRTAFPVFVHPPLQKKTSAEPWRLPTAGGKRRGKERGAREGGTAGR